MGNLSSVNDDGDEGHVKSRAERWAMAKRCVALLQISFPDAGLETVMLLPRETLLRFEHIPSFEEAEPYLRPVLTLTDKKKYPMGGGKTVYLSHLVGDHLERRWVPGTTPKTTVEAAAKAAAAAATAAGGAVAVAVAAAAAGAAQAASCAAIAKRASAIGEASDLYATASAFLLENPEYMHIWVPMSCLPPRLRKQRWRGALPSVAGSNMFDHLHPGALLACDAMLVAPPERESMAWSPEQRERYSDLEMFSMSPWKTLEGAVSLLMDTATFYSFRLGESLIFSGPYGSTYPDHPPPSPLDPSRRSSAPPSVVGGGESPLEGGRGLSSESPVSRARAAASVAAKALLSKGSRMGWNSKPEKEAEDGRWNGIEWESAGGRSSGSTTTPSSWSSAGNHGNGSGNGTGNGTGNGNGGLRRRRASSGPESSRVDKAVCEALDRLGANGLGTPPERNWRGVLQPSYLLRKAHDDVDKFSEAQGALKQAMCSMSVSREQAEEFFGVWKYLGAMGPSATEDRLAALNLLLFAVSVSGGYFCPSRPRDFVGRVMKESLVTPGHLDLWMKDLSPDDSRNILKAVNVAGKKLSILTIGSSHTAGAGVGSFLRGHPMLKELELEWEGVRDLSSIASALADHKSLTRLNLTHNEIGPRGAIQLGEALRHNKSLTEIDLRENSLGPAGMKSIADALAENDSMRSLHLQDNAIGDDGVIHMTEALMRNGRLRTVCLDGNQVTGVGAKVICIAIKMNLALKLLSLSRNALPDESKRALYDAWSQREVEEGQDRSGMFLEQAAAGTVPGRGGWSNGLPPVEGVFVSTRPGEDVGGGVLVSPTRDQRDRRAGSGNGARGGGGGNVPMMPRFSPVNDTFVKKPLW